jgi:hypothetical protein
MNEVDKNHAKWMCWCRYGLRVVVVAFLLVQVFAWSNRLTESLRSAKLPAVYVLTTEEFMADSQDKPMSQPPSVPPGSPAVSISPTSLPPVSAVINITPQASKQDSDPQKRVVKKESSWVQFAHSTLLFVTQAVVLAVLVWGIVAVVKHDD